MVARNPAIPDAPPAAPTRLTRAAAIAKFREADATLFRVAQRTVEAKERIAAASGIHVDELERLIGNEPATEASSRAAAARRRRADASEVTLPDGYEFPAAPAGMSSHPAVQRGFRTGVAASFERAPSCVYGNRGIAAACAAAWSIGLRMGREMQRAKAAT